MRIVASEKLSQLYLQRPLRSFLFRFLLYFLCFYSLHLFLCCEVWKRRNCVHLICMEMFFTLPLWMCNVFSLHKFSSLASEAFSIITSATDTVSWCFKLAMRRIYFHKSLQLSNFFKSFIFKSKQIPHPMSQHLREGKALENIS